MVPGEPPGARHELCGARNTKPRSRRDSQERGVLLLRFRNNYSAALLKPLGRWAPAAAAEARWRTCEDGQGSRPSCANAMTISKEAFTGELFPPPASSDDLVCGPYEAKAGSPPGTFSAGGIAQTG